LRAQRHADADLLRALSDYIGDHAIDADRGESEGEGREGSEKNHGEAPRRDGIGDDAFHRLIAIDHLLIAHLAAGAADGVEDRGQVSFVTHYETRA
jgi:hypothetical protein